jgi:hypothetical protein
MSISDGLKDKYVKLYDNGIFFNIYITKPNKFEVSLVFIFAFFKSLKKSCINIMYKMKQFNRNLHFMIMRNENAIYTDRHINKSFKRQTW